MFDFWFWSSWLIIKLLGNPKYIKINLFFRPLGGQIAKNLVEGGLLFLEAKKIYMDLLPDYFITNAKDTHFPTTHLVGFDDQIPFHT